MLGETEREGRKRGRREGGRERKFRRELTSVRGERRKFAKFAEFAIIII